MPTGTNKQRLAMAGAAAVVVLAGAVGANAAGDGAERERANNQVIKVTLRGVDGGKVGWVSLRTKGDHVVVRGFAHGLTPGFHGFHIHAIGLCEANAPAGPFTTAGGHFTGGLTTNHADHAGDMPSLLVTSTGRAFSSFVTDRFGLADLRDTDGSAVMVHAGRDNFANIPPERYATSSGPGPDATTLMTGDAGARAACGVIR